MTDQSKGTYNYTYGKSETGGTGTAGENSRDAHGYGPLRQERVTDIRRLLAAGIDPRPSSTETTRDFIGDIWDILDEAGNLLISKHKDYGPTNISRSPGGPLNGLRVRMWDKVARINHLVDHDLDPEHESLRDSFIDLLNYSAIAIMVLEGKWPEK